MEPACGGGWRFRIRTSLLVHQGCVGIGILRRDGSSFAQEVSTAQSSSWREIALVTPNLDEAGPLVVRNNSGLGVSRVQLGILEAEPVANEFSRAPEAEHRDRPWPRPLGPLLDDLSCGALLELAQNLAILKGLGPMPKRFGVF